MKARWTLHLMLVLLLILAFSLTAFAPSRQINEILSLPDTPLVHTAASVLPSTTVAFAALDLSQMREQGIAALSDLFNLEKAATLGMNETPSLMVDRLVNQFYYLYSGFSSPIAGITVNERDVTPWLGDHFIIAVIQHDAPATYDFEATATPALTPTPTQAIFVTPLPETVRRMSEQRVRENARHEFVVLIQSKDDNAAARFVSSARLQTEGRYGPMDQFPVSDGFLYALPRYRTPQGHNSWANPLGQVPGYVIMGRPRAIEAIQNVRHGAEPSLAESVGFQPPDAEESSVFAGWGNLQAMSELWWLFWYTRTGSPQDYDYSRERRLWGELFGQGALKAALQPGGNVRLHAQYRAQFPVGFPTTPADTPFPSLASLFPADTLFLAEGRNARLLYRFIRETLLTLADRLDDPINFIDGRLAAEQTIATWELRFGSQLDELLEPLSGSLALGMIYSPSARLTNSNFPFALVLIGETDTPAQASEVAANLDNLIRAGASTFWPQGSISFATQQLTIGGYSFQRLSIVSITNGREVASVTYGAMNNRVLVATGDGVERIAGQNAGLESLVGSPAWQMTLGEVTDFGDVLVYYNNLKTFRFARQNLNTVDREILERLSVYLEGINTVSLILKWPDQNSIDAVFQLTAADDNDP